MFDRVAPRYDALNRILSGGRDVGWRRRAIALARLGPRDVALDVGVAYRLYFHRLSPLIAATLGGDAAAYRYLPRSVAAFPNAEGLAAHMRDAGFARVRYERLNLGIAAIHVGEA